MFGQSVLVSDNETLKRKLANIVDSGPKTLKIVSDFDFTITRFKINGERGASCHKIIEDCGLLSAEYHKQAQGLQRKYYPLEVDPTIDQETKTKYMIEWVTEAHELLVKNKLSKMMIQTAVRDALKQKASVGFRDNFVAFIEKIQSNKIPLLIFSAGLADVLNELLLLQLKKFDTSLLHVISNEGIFDETDGFLTRFIDPTLHVFNKKSLPFLDRKFFTDQDIVSRTNVLLIGDSLGDVTMADGMQHNPENIIKVGFLNDRVEERMETYMEQYDIVVLGDAGFDVPLGIIELVCGTKSGKAAELLNIEEL